ncbi:MAG: acyl carrier protein [Ruminococcus sp.]|nr:acyl carrier protein [Ruminococcus sp.]
MEFEKLQKIIAESMGDISESEITPETRFVEDLHADSLDVLEIIMAIEDEFDIQIPDDAAEIIKTVQDAADQIKKMVD